MSTAELLWDCRCDLGEGALWHAAEQAIYSTDIESCEVLACDVAGRAQRRWSVPQRIGWILPRRDGGWVAGLAAGVAALQLNGDGTTRLDWLHPLHDTGSPLRLNDAATDARGRLWFGSMNFHDMRRPDGVFYRLDPGREPVAVDTGYGVTNGPVFSADGRTLYHTDTLARTIYAFDVDDGGTLSGKRAWLQLAADEGFPDGMTTDAEGCVWIAHWGGSRVTRRDGAGRILRTIAVPAPHVTNVAFGGPDLTDLFITSARSGLDAAGLAAAPLSGGLFVVRNAGRGVLPPAYAG